MLYIVLTLLGFAGTKLITPYFEGMIREAGLERKNYLGDNIPVSMGISFLPFILINCTIILYFKSMDFAGQYMFAIMAMSFVGIIDDIIGNRDSSGFKGHFKALFRGRLTTGAFKALFGGFVAVFVSVSVSKDILDIVLNTLLIALSANFFNLMDLRPGRAIKVYFASCMMLMPLLPEPVRLLAAGSISPVAAYFARDIKARAMMGDVGSNAIGVSVGVIMVFGLEGHCKVAALAILLFIHILAEKYSITRIIEKNRLLDYIDKIGR